MSATNPDARLEHHFHSESVRQAREFAQSFLAFPAVPAEAANLRRTKLHASVGNQRHCIDAIRPQRGEHLPCARTRVRVRKLRRKAHALLEKYFWIRSV